MPTSVEDVLAMLRAEADEKVRSDMVDRYGIHTPKALGVRMRDMKGVAKRIGTDHVLAQELWGTGWYEARIVASLIEDSESVSAEQMDAWCADFDNWAVVDTVCFNLFDRCADAWNKVDEWARSDAEFVKRAGFALLWSLAGHDRDAADDEFRSRLPLIEASAGDERHLVHKAVDMALRAIGKRRPAVAPDVVATARRLVESGDRTAARVGKSALKALGESP